MIDIPDSIFPKDAQGQSLCPRCQLTLNKCACPSGEIPKPKHVQPAFNAHARLEKSGRGGKMVTLIEGLPKDENFLKKLAKQLKSSTGSGGTHYITADFGVIEIQGNHVDTLRQQIKTKALGSHG